MEIRFMQDGAGYEVVKEGIQVGRIVWTLDGDTMVMNGTHLDESLRGQDLGTKLLNHAAEYARDNHYKMKAVCPFVVKMFERSEGYNDVKL